MGQFIAVSKFLKKTIASCLFLYIEFYWLPFLWHEDIGFDVSPLIDFLPALYIKTFSPVSAGWAK